MNSSNEGILFQLGSSNAGGQWAAVDEPLYCILSPKDIVVAKPRSANQCLHPNQCPELFFEYRRPGLRHKRKSWLLSFETGLRNCSPSLFIISISPF
jgi:hypothetical protein